jgi:hypothetical protein
VFTGGPLAVGLSGALAAFGLFASGALGSFFTGQPVLSSGARQAGFGMAEGITFVLARWSEPDLDSEHSRSVTQRNLTSNPTASD